MITGVILARNEEKNIADCIDTFGPHVDELFLIDMESEDRTVEIARPRVDRILPHPLVDQFDAARNIAIEPAKFNWLWFCDADERVSDHVGRTVRDLVKHRGDEFEALSIPFKTFFCGKWIEHCGWWPGYTMPRVMKKGRFHFRQQVHGGVQVDGREVRLPADPAYGIDHFSYESVHHYFEKFNRYTSTEASQLAGRGVAWDWREATQAMMRDLWMYYEHNAGHRDHAHGWILSWLSGHYRWASHAKLIDHGGKSAALHSFPASLDEVIDEMRGELHRLRSPKPTLPLGVVWKTPWRDPSGYADEGRCIAKALAQGERKLLLEEIDWNDKRVELSPADATLLKALSHAKRPVDAVTITNCIPTLAKPDPAARFNVLRTTFETDRIPEHWLPHLLAFDEVWVISKHNQQAFVRSGFPPERLRVIPSLLDEQLFQPTGEGLETPVPESTQFTFLSVFDWQLRKGWDVLLSAYLQEFTQQDNTALLLKISRGHGHPMEVVRQQADAVLAKAGTSLEDRPDIVLWDEMLPASDMARLYRSVDAFVLPTRGEGWGRPFMEAMACGVPTIGTAASGNVDFMNDDNSLLIPCTEAAVSSQAIQEIVTYAGQTWFEPDADELRKQLRLIHDDEPLRQRLGEKGYRHIHDHFGITAGGEHFEAAIQAIEKIVAPAPLPPAAPDQLRVELQGEVFANHSFSNINEWLIDELGGDSEVALAMRPRYNMPMSRTDARYSRVAPFLNRDLGQAPQVTIRHAYPPDFTPVESGKWVHIQPWEFGHLPVDWIEPLNNGVDEIWAPSNYVRDIYIRSGVPGDKVHVIPWGVDEEYFHADAPPRFLSTEKSFKFLYVGGTIPRKGFDVLLDAYLKEFTAADDVCLVIKDVGHSTVYRYSHFRQQIFAAQQDESAPEILYIDDDYSPGQLASLYAACDALAAPYRGEGFGLPILEAMACGTAVIVPQGGPTDDFVDKSVGYIIPSKTTQTQHPDTLCGPPTELSVHPDDVRYFMRRAFAGTDLTAKKSIAGAHRVAASYTWRHTSAKMKQRMRALLTRPDQPANESTVAELPLTVIIDANEVDANLADCLARISPAVGQVVVFREVPNDRLKAIATEYGAEFVAGDLRHAQDQSHFDTTMVAKASDRFTPAVWEQLKDAIHEEHIGSSIVLDGREYLLVCTTRASGAAT